MSSAPNLIQKQSQKQTQTVAFTPQLCQAIGILELSNLDLQTHVTQQITDNPFLEGEDDILSKSQSNDTTETKDSIQDPPTQEEREKEYLYQEMDSDNYDNVWSSDKRLTSNSHGSSQSSHQGLTGSFDHIASDRFTLRDHLLSQINTDIPQEKERLIAQILVDHLDETGYFSTSIDEVAETLGTSVVTVETILVRLKQCDPAGVFAGSLKECMTLQLKDLGQLDKKTKAVLEYIDLFAEAKVQELLAKTGCTPAELKKIIEKFKRLDPKPGLKFNHESLQSMVPDVFMNKSKEDGSWTIRLNNETLPRVLVSQDYKIRANLNLKKDKDLRKYYQERMGEANWLVRALDQRAQNILKVVEEIVRQQDAFFEKGITALKPMTLKQVADVISVHESTVSRITQNKYLASPRGVFELRYFFSASITNAWTGEDQSALQIQHQIQKIVQDENPKKPLSDGAIVLKLSDYNFDVARRTISKYRELLKIPSSYERKRQYLRNLSL